MGNRDYSRPDFKPKAAMVKDTDMLYDQQSVDQINALYRGRRDPEDTKKGTLYRFFFPLDANYGVNKNPWGKADPLELSLIHI